MMFLNAVDEGGPTQFPEAKVRISPRKGNLLVWTNLDERGAPSMASLHQGMPVLAGVKSVITQWYPERPWPPGLAAAKPPCDRMRVGSRTSVSVRVVLGGRRISKTRK